MKKQKKIHLTPRRKAEAESHPDITMIRSAKEKEGYSSKKKHRKRKSLKDITPRERSFLSWAEKER